MQMVTADAFFCNPSGRKTISILHMVNIYAAEKSAVGFGIFLGTGSCFNLKGEPHIYEYFSSLASSTHVSVPMNFCSDWFVFAALS